MCVINGPAEVSNTRIFVSPDSTGLRQVVIYSNNIKNKSSNNVMILAVPNPNSIKFHEVSNDIFDYLKQFLPSSNGKGLLNYSCEDSIKIYDIGSYIAYIAKSTADFITMNHIFSINPKVYELFDKTYDTSIFGFLVLKLKDDATEINYKPICYSHEVFDNNVGYLFVPTLHYHEDDAADESNYVFFADTFENKKAKLDWDHEIYVLTNRENNYNIKLNNSHTSKLNMCFSGSNKFVIPDNYFLKLYKIKSNLDKNCDLYHRYKTNKPVVFKNYLYIITVDGFKIYFKDKNFTFTNDYYENLTTHFYYNNFKLNINYALMLSTDKKYNNYFALVYYSTKNAVESNYKFDLIKVFYNYSDNSYKSRRLLKYDDSSKMYTKI